MHRGYNGYPDITSSEELVISIDSYLVVNSINTKSKSYEEKVKIDQLPARKAVVNGTVIQTFSHTTIR